ncbi:DUF3108 domain-containing protein [Pseudoxanthomonas composti]|uniref:DUF3108 domain-containing protein n=1 Tax=Pseudoxanthomonas composti TaxID=2137479 RepID=A0A4Q1K207_9GAMM|nr:DUF3108 domain-containing protein [Pseudoxanthomonas composti]RXR08616.1 DUF3108 domain-containing protein [Pseudoxanthomonas composti]
MNRTLSGLLAFAALAMPGGAAWALEPFSATYEAYYKGRLAGDASMRVSDANPQYWQINLDLHGNRGVAGLLALNIDQSTAFSVEGDGHFRPLSQATTQRAVFRSKRAVGMYDWRTRKATWTGDLDEKRLAPIDLEPRDQSALLMNLAVIRDAEPGKSLSYRVVDLGRVRQYDYTVATEREIVEVDGLSYNAMRVSRTNGGDKQTVFWIAEGVPTPIRILQRKDGQDDVDLRLIQYQGVQ